MLARLRTGKPGPTVALRADIDALPIDERERRRVRLRAPGRDARVRARRAHGDAARRGARAGRAELRGGELRFIFQHAEELAPGGARDMVAAGVMEGVDFIYGCHLWTPLEYGKVAAVPGPFMAAADFFKLTITGRGGHAGLPHTAVDTVAAAAELVGSLQHIVSRRIDPLEPAVVTIGSIHAGDAPNVIPGEAVLTGHVALVRPGRARADPEADRGDRRGGLRGARRHARAGLPVRLQARRQRGARDRARPRSDRGSELVDIDPIMGGDDFSAFQAEAPGCYAFIGAGGEYPHHHPRFRIDERALATGTRLHVQIARRALEEFA